MSRAVLLSLMAGGFLVQQVYGLEENGGTRTARQGDEVFVESFVKGLQYVQLKHKTHSPDGKLFAGFYQDGWTETISIHDAKTGKQIRRIVGQGDFVRQFLFSDDGKVLASHCDKRGWKLWDVSTGKLLSKPSTVTRQSLNREASKLVKPVDSP